MSDMITVQFNMEMTKEMFSELKPFLEGLAGSQEFKEISLSRAARKFGWSVSTLYRWVMKEKRIPYRQPKASGTIYLLESDCRKLQEMGRPEPEKKKPERKRRTARIREYM